MGIQTDEEIRQEKALELMSALEKQMEALGYNDAAEFIRDGAQAIGGIAEAMTEDEKTEMEFIGEIEEDETNVCSIANEQDLKRVQDMLALDFNNTRPLIVKFGSERTMLPGMVAEYYKQKADELEQECMMLASQLPQGDGIDDMEKEARSEAMASMFNAIPSLIPRLMQYIPENKPDFYAKTFQLGEDILISIPENFTKGKFICAGQLVEVTIKPCDEMLSEEESDVPEGNGSGQEPAK